MPRDLDGLGPEDLPSLYRGPFEPCEDLDAAVAELADAAAHEPRFEADGLAPEIYPVGLGRPAWMTVGESENQRRCKCKGPSPLQYPRRTLIAAAVLIVLFAATLVLPGSHQSWAADEISETMYENSHQGAVEQTIQSRPSGRELGDNTPTSPTVGYWH